jgi:hypothetical protein
LQAALEREKERKNPIRRCFLLRESTEKDSIVSDGRVKRLFTITLVELAESKERVALVLEEA